MASGTYTGSNQKRACNGCTIMGSNVDITGNNNQIFGSNACVKGNGNQIFGSNARVKGNGNTIQGANGKATGNGNVINGTGGRATGSGNVVNAGGGTKRKSISQQEVISQIFNQGVVTNTFGSDGLIQTFTQGVMTNIGSGGIIQTINNLPNVKKAKETEYVEGPAPAELEHDTEAPEGKECVICMTNAIICIVWPCRHACLCVKCSRTLCFGPDEGLKEQSEVACPKCRGQVEKILRIY